MKVVFAAQGSILNVFHAMDVELRKQGLVSSSAYWVADSEYYETQLSQFDILQHSDTRVLKEWDYTELKNATLPDNWAELEQKYESLDCIWNAVVADRRLMFGRLCKTRQSYGARFTHEQLKVIVFRALGAIDAMLTEFQPDRIVTFVPATFGDILFAHAAKVHGVEYRILRSTKVGNYVAFSDQLGSSSTWFEHVFQENLKNLRKQKFYEQAEAFLKHGSASPVDYEGSIAAKRNSVFSLLKRYVVGAVGVAVQQLRRIQLRVTSDNHLPPTLTTYLYGNLFREYREMQVRRLMKTRQCTIERVREEPYVFYPMHCEPEVALSVYGREHQNQIETIRRIAQSIPLSWKLVVKEHPRSISGRSVGYYKKLLDIPNLVFADPETKPFYWNQLAKAVITVSGFAGFEAAMVGTPVIVLGDASFSVLPSQMVRTVKDMGMLADEIKDLRNNYKQSEPHLLSYIMANMQVGVDVNLYSDLLVKSGRITMRADSVSSQIERLAGWLADDFNGKHGYIIPSSSIDNVGDLVGNE